MNNQPQWTQEEAIDYECAREAITHARSIYYSQIYKEEAKPQPDMALLAELRTEAGRLFEERRSLRVKNQAENVRVQEKYGAFVRAWNAKQEAVAA